MSEEAFPSENARHLAHNMRLNQQEILQELTRTGVRIVKVKATIEFEAYARTEGFGTGQSMEQVIEQEIAGAIGYRAPGGAYIQDNGSLIVMANATPPDFAVQVTSIDVLPTNQPVDLDLMREEATELSDNL